MKAQRLILIALILGNVLLLTLTVFRPGAAEAQEAQGVAPMLRGRGLEIVDDRGHVRASITIFPATRGYPETVLLRLHTSEGRPNVKIAATEDGSALVLGGQSDPTFIQALARGAKTSVKLENKTGRQRVIKP
jgi:hypothetical protein